MIPRGNHDGVDVFVLHDFAQILSCLRVRVGFFGAVESNGVRIAEVSDLDTWDGGHSFCITAALTTEADARDAYGVIGTPDSGCRQGGEGESGLPDEGAAGSRSRWHDR